MLVTGEIKRNIYPQDGDFNYVINIQCDNITGHTIVGWSGLDYEFFSLKSGKIYYTKKNYYLDNYVAYQPINISGNISSDKHTVFINNLPKLIGEPKPTGYYNYFYCNSQNTETTIGVSLLGTKPNYEYDIFKTYFSGEQIPINIVNFNNYPFKIFSGQIVGNPNFSLNAYNITVPGNSTGNIILTSEIFTPGNQNIPIRLYTNFGNLDFNFIASGQTLADLNFYILFGPEQNSVISDGQTNDYTLYVRNTSSMNFITSLEYISGETGNYYKPILVTNEGTGGPVRGIITGSGFLTGTGLGLLTYNNPLIPGNETGIGTGLFRKFAYATGQINYQYGVYITGLGSGAIYEQYRATGYIDTILYTGEIGYNGGWVNVPIQVPVFGSGLHVTALVADFNKWDKLNSIYWNDLNTKWNELKETITGYNVRLLTGYLNSAVARIFIPYTGNIYIPFDENQYEFKERISDTEYYVGPISKFYTLEGVAYATGRHITGKLVGPFGRNFNPGKYTFFKGFTGLGTGFSHILETFYPVTVEIAQTGTQGIIGGLYSTEFNTDNCDFEEPFIIPTGYPTTITDRDGLVTISPITVVTVSPNNKIEYLNDQLGNPNSRVSISRGGATSSGTGYYNQPFQQPFYESGVWTETLGGINVLQSGHQRRIVTSIEGNPYLMYESDIQGYFRITGNYNGYQTFTWDGWVENGANFQNYALTIERVTNTGLQFVANARSAYNYSVNLKTGLYRFVLTPTENVGGVPKLSIPTTAIYGFKLDKTISIPVYLEYKTNGNVFVEFETIDNTAQENIDYTISNKILEIPADNIGVNNLNIQINNSNLIGGDKTFYLRIVNIWGGFIVNKYDLIGQVIQVNIIDNDIYRQDEGCCSNDNNLNDGHDALLCKELLKEHNFTGGDGFFTRTISLSRALRANEILTFRLLFDGNNDRVIIKMVRNNGPTLVIYDGNCPTIIANRTFSLVEGAMGLIIEVHGGCINSMSNRLPWTLTLSCDKGLVTDPPVEDPDCPLCAIIENFNQKLSGQAEIAIADPIIFPRPVKPEDNLIVRVSYRTFKAPDTIVLRSFKDTSATILLNKQCISTGDTYAKDPNQPFQFEDIVIPVGTTRLQFYVDGVSCRKPGGGTYWEAKIECITGCCSTYLIEDGCSCNIGPCCCPRDFAPDQSNCPNTYGGCIPMPCVEYSTPLGWFRKSYDPSAYCSELNFSTVESGASRIINIEKQLSSPIPSDVSVELSVQFNALATADKLTIAAIDSNGLGTIVADIGCSIGIKNINVTLPTGTKKVQFVIDGTCSGENTMSCSLIVSAICS